MLREMLSDWPGRLILGGLTFALALVVAGIVAVVEAGRKDAERWEAFAREHECKVVGRMTGDTATGVGLTVSPSGKVGTVTTVTTTPDKTGYACNDGVTYWR